MTSDSSNSVLVVALLIFHLLLCEAICTIRQPMPNTCEQAAMKLESDPSYLTTYCTNQCANPLLANCRNSDVANLTLALCAMQDDHYCYRMYMDAVAELNNQECSHTCTDDCYTAATNFTKSLGCCLMKYTELNVSKDVFTGLDVLSTCNINIEQFCSNPDIIIRIENTTYEETSPTTATTEEATTQSNTTTTEKPTADDGIPDGTNVTDIEDDVMPNVEDRDCIQDQYPHECMNQLHLLTPNSPYNVVVEAVSMICSSKCFELTMEQIKCENDTVINAKTLCMLHNDQYCYANYLEAISMVPEVCLEEEICSELCSSKYKLLSERLGCCLGAFAETEKFGAMMASCNIAVDQPCDLKLSSTDSGCAVNTPSLLLNTIVVGAIMFAAKFL